jgi:hypothetical protein
LQVQQVCWRQDAQSMGMLTYCSPTKLFGTIGFMKMELEGYIPMSLSVGSLSVGGASVFMVDVRTLSDDF